MDDREFGEYVRGLFAELPAARLRRRGAGAGDRLPLGAARRLLPPDRAGHRAAREMSPAERDAAIAEHTAAPTSGCRCSRSAPTARPTVLRAQVRPLPRGGDRAVLASPAACTSSTSASPPSRRSTARCRRRSSPAPGRRSASTILWVTPAQFTQLAWSELSYRLGRLRDALRGRRGRRRLRRGARLRLALRRLPRRRRARRPGGGPGRGPHGADADPGAGARRRGGAGDRARGERGDRWSGPSSRTSPGSSRAWSRPSTANPCPSPPSAGRRSPLGPPCVQLYRPVCPSMKRSVRNGAAH